VQMDAPSPSQKPPLLSKEELKECTRRAQQDGAFAGVTSGLVGGLIGSRIMGFTRNKTILCGVLTGVLSGYFFTQAFLGSQIAEATHLRALTVRRNSEGDPKDDAAQ